MNLLLLSLCFLLSVFMPPPQPSWFPVDEKKSEYPGHAFTELRTDIGWVGPNQTFHVVVLITPDEGWHVYWKNPGASGSATEFELEVPDGFTVGEPMYPRPTIFYGEEGETYGYNKPAAIFIPITSPEFLTDGHAKISVTTTWLACQKSCVMGEEKNEIEFSTHFNEQGPLNKDMQLSRWAKSLPRQLSDLKDGLVSMTGTTLVISGNTNKRPLFFIGIEHKYVRFDKAEQPIIDGNAFRLRVPIRVDTYELGDNPVIVDGLLLLGRNPEDPCFIIHTEAKPYTRTQ
jgi:DsbC/DsbD-like thiol-disulfide interchange protein